MSLYHQKRKLIRAAKELKENAIHPGSPLRTLLKYYQKLMKPRDYLNRKILSFGNNPHENITRDLFKNGFCKTDEKELKIDPKLKNFCCELYQRKKMQVETEVYKNRDNLSKKSYWDDLLEGEVLLNDSVLVKIALQENILKLVSSYLREAPRLASIQLFYSPKPIKKLKLKEGSSQQWHRDKDDTKQVKLFYFPKDVVYNSGPTHFLPRKFSKKVPNLFIEKRVLDQTILELGFQKHIVECVGTAGTVFLGDTSKVYHYGSRGNEMRLLLIIQYTTNYPKWKSINSFLFSSDELKKMTPLQKAAILR